MHLRQLDLLAVLICALAFAFSAHAQVTDKAKTSDKPLEDQPLTITKKPRPSASGCRSFGITGLTRLKVTFDKSAKVTEVVQLTSSGCPHFDKTAIKAARKMKFTPKIKNGEPVSVVKQVEYTYTVY